MTALSDVTLELEPGIIGLVGANGAGKSTFIRILLGLLPPTSGKAFVMDLDVTREGTTVRALVGYMPEHDCPRRRTCPRRSSSRTWAELSGLPKAAARERTAEVLRHVGLYEERYRPIGGYSTGMQQRVKLAQALVHDPRLLLLDEPTNGLDPAGREDMLALVQRTGSEFGIAILLASHLLGEIERSATSCRDRRRAAAPRRRRSRVHGADRRAAGRARRRCRRARRRGWSPPGLASRVERAQPVRSSSSTRRATTRARHRSPSSTWRWCRIEQQRRHRLEELFRDEPEPASRRVTGRRRRPTARPWTADVGQVGRRGQRRREPSTTSATAATAGCGSAGATPWPRSCASRSASAAGSARPGRAKLVPFGLAVIVDRPGHRRAGILALVGRLGAGTRPMRPTPIRTTSYYGLIASVVFLFAAAQAPELLARDLRHRVLSLYFSRTDPPRRTTPSASWSRSWPRCSIMVLFPQC